MTIIRLLLVVILAFNGLAYAEPVSAAMPALFGGHSECTLTGVRFDPGNPLNLKFILSGDIESAQANDAARESIAYFMAALTLPDNDLWVNLSPYEKDRIVEDNLGQTDLGKGMLNQDYLLKQIASSLTNPDTDVGKKYWQDAQASTQAIFTKVWITPGKADIYEGEYSALIMESDLKVMMEDKSAVAFKANILPLIEKEINNGKNFTQLRRIYSALILAVWFKQKFSESFYADYINKKKISGIDLADKHIKDKVYAQYIDAFKRGAYNYTKKERDRGRNKLITRRYFSGGVAMGDLSRFITRVHDLPFQFSVRPSMEVNANFHEVTDNRLKEIYERHRSTNVLAVDDIDKSIIPEAISILNSLGERGAAIARRLGDLSKGAGINLVFGAYHSHAGGRGIHVAYHEDMTVDDIIYAIVHEAIAGNIFGIHKVSHGFGRRIVSLIMAGRSAQAKDMIDNLPEGLRLGDEPIWVMDDKARAGLEGQRDYATLERIRAAADNKLGHASGIFDVGVDTSVGKEEMLRSGLRDIFAQAQTDPDIMNSANSVDMVGYLLSYLSFRGYLRWNYASGDPVRGRVNIWALNSSKNSMDKHIYDLLLAVLDRPSGIAKAIRFITREDDMVISGFVGDWGEFSEDDTVLVSGDAATPFAEINPVIVLPHSDYLQKITNIVGLSSSRESFYDQDENHRIGIVRYDADSRAQRDNEVNALRALAGLNVDSVPEVLMLGEDDRLFAKMRHIQDGLDSLPVSLAFSRDFLDIMPRSNGVFADKDKDKVVRGMAILFGNIATALQGVHDAGYVHAGVIGDNVFLSPNGTVELRDFTKSHLDGEGVTQEKLEDIAALGRVFVAVLIAGKVDDARLTRLVGDMAEGSSDIRKDGLAAVANRLSVIGRGDDLGGIDFKRNKFKLSIKSGVSSFSHGFRKLIGLRLGAVDIKKVSTSDILSAWNIIPEKK